MEKNINFIIDVDPGEAESLVRLIEMLIEDWYVTRHGKEMRRKTVIEIAQKKSNGGS
jgi:hypothetical protein